MPSVVQVYKKENYLQLLLVLVERNLGQEVLFLMFQGLIIMFDRVTSDRVILLVLIPVLVGTLVVLRRVFSTCSLHSLYLELRFILGEFLMQLSQCLMYLSSQVYTISIVLTMWSVSFLSLITIPLIQVREVLCQLCTWLGL